MKFFLNLHLYLYLLDFIFMIYLKPHNNVTSFLVGFHTFNNFITLGNLRYFLLDFNLNFENFHLNYIELLKILNKFLSLTYFYSKLQLLLKFTLLI